MTLEEARAFIAASSWTPARQPLGGPHEYTVRGRGADPEGWWSFARYIRDHGVRKPWPAPPARARQHNHYAIIDGWEYWGPCAGSPPCLNRQLVAG
jgi:hypothetical protein